MKVNRILDQEQHSIIINNNRDHNKLRVPSEREPNTSGEVETREDRGAEVQRGQVAHQKPISFTVHPLAIWRECESVSDSQNNKN